MKFPFVSRSSGAGRGGRRAGSVLIIVLWVAFGLVSIALYFASSMSYEFRAADNRVAATEADQAIAGAARYVTNLLANVPTAGALPATNTFLAANVPVGESTFWLLGRDPNATGNTPSQQVFGLVDEAAKLNLNFATSNMLALLPRMTAELAASIVTWRSTNAGTDADVYQRLQPPYLCKQAPFETIEELRLILNMDLVTLYGEDANLNGVLDPNENDGDTTPPADDSNGQLDPGLLEYVTVYSREPAVQTNGTPRVSVVTTAPGPAGQAQLRNLLTQQFDAARVGRWRLAGHNSVLEFAANSGMSAAEFAQVEDKLRGPRLEGLVNVSTASAVVLACIPGLDANSAAQLVAYRRANPDSLTSLAWVVNVLTDRAAIRTAGPWFTARTYQCTADVASVGHYGRGYRRTKFVLDTSEGTPKIRFRQDLTHLGWALGKDVRNNLLLAKANR